VVWDVGPWKAEGKISFISRDGQLVSGFGLRSVIHPVLVGLGELCVGSFEGEGSTLGDADRLDVVSQSIRLKMVNYA